VPTEKVPEFLEKIKIEEKKKSITNIKQKLWLAPFGSWLPHLKIGFPFGKLATSQ
jgi:hypothetical protein